MSYLGMECICSTQRQVPKNWRLLFVFIWFKRSHHHCFRCRRIALIRKRSAAHRLKVPSANRTANYGKCFYLNVEYVLAENVNLFVGHTEQESIACEECNTCTLTYLMVCRPIRVIDSGNASFVPCRWSPFNKKTIQMEVLQRGIAHWPFFDTPAATGRKHQWMLSCQESGRTRVSFLISFQVKMPCIATHLPAERRNAVIGYKRSECSS